MPQQREEERKAGAAARRSAPSVRRSSWARRYQRLPFFKKRQKSRFLQKIGSFKIITRSNKVYLQAGSLHGAGVRDCGVLTHWCLCGVWHVVNIHNNSWAGEWINGWMRGLAGCPVLTGWEVCLPRIPWENPVSSGSMPMEALELAWTRGLAGSQSSKELG